MLRRSAEVRLAASRSIESAARLLALTAAAYREAGLGLFAKQSLLDAAACHSRLGHSEEAAACTDAAAGIPVLWDSNEGGAA